MKVLIRKTSGWFSTAMYNYRRVQKQAAATSQDDNRGLRTLACRQGFTAPFALLHIGSRLPNIKGATAEVQTLGILGWNLRLTMVQNWGVMLLDCRGTCWILLILRTKQPTSSWKPRSCSVEDPKCHVATCVLFRSQTYSICYAPEQPGQSRPIHAPSVKTKPRLCRNSIYSRICFICV